MKSKEEIKLKEVKDQQRNIQSRLSYKRWLNNKSEVSLLSDYRSRNLEEWIQAGGSLIQFRNSSVDIDPTSLLMDSHDHSCNGSPEQSPSIISKPSLLIGLPRCSSPNIKIKTSLMNIKVGGDLIKLNHAS